MDLRRIATLWVFAGGRISRRGRPSGLIRVGGRGMWLLCKRERAHSSWLGGEPRGGQIIALAQRDRWGTMKLLPVGLEPTRGRVSLTGSAPVQPKCTAFACFATGATS